MAKYYAWSNIRNGGEVKTVDLPANKGTRTVVVSRNVTAFGEEVTAKKIGCSDADWEALIEGGSVRSYAPPEGTSDYVSPAQAFMEGMLTDRGDIDMNKLMELGLAHPVPINQPADTEDAVVGA